jgi:archaellum component FlaC
MSDTPISDSTPHNVADLGMLCRRLERELNAANERIKRLEEELERTKQDRNAIAKKTREPLLLKLDHAAERIKRLEEAGDAILNANNDDEEYEAIKQWNKAKEAKP